MKEAQTQAIKLARQAAASYTSDATSALHIVEDPYTASLLRESIQICQLVHVLANRCEELSQAILNLSHELR